MGTYHGKNQVGYRHSLLPKAFSVYGALINILFDLGIFRKKKM